ncbi:MAG: COQ9 family protein [Alphaproteobacteria bacterium]|jgi:ubiquinone biosynthesis protein COQ9|nr:COQ9 family protein [Alphaproteobacteria bacterium]
MTEDRTVARTDARRMILEAALDAVPFDGWSDKMLAETVESAAAKGIDPAQATAAFPGGVKQLLAFFMAEADRQMIEAAAAQGLGEGPIRDRIGGIIRLRLESLAPHREAIRRALAIQLFPRRAPTAVAGLYRTVDAIWRAAGDDSTDFNYYSKRAILAAVYSSTLLRWLDDQSDDCDDTWAFMERRIAGSLRIGKIRRRLEKMARRLPSPLPVLTRLRYGRSPG